MVSFYMAVIIALRSDIGTAVLAYLHETLGITPEVRPWPDAAKLPYFLQDTFDVLELQLSDREILLAIHKHPNKVSLANVRRQMDKLRHHAGLPVVYVTAALASYERKRLIEQKVPFIVPGNQLYLPELGLDLREYFRERPGAHDAPLSPATQAMLMAVLLREPGRLEWRPADVARDLGYSAMTLSRAVKELTAGGVAAVHTRGRTRWLEMKHSAPATWEHAKPLLRSPIKRRFWAKPVATWSPPNVRLAGVSALARDSMIAEPEWPIYAISPALWRETKKAGVQSVPEHMPGACEWELWHYDPAIVPDRDTVDPLSLTLCLQASPDERIQLALDELKGRFPW